MGWEQIVGEGVIAPFVNQLEEIFHIPSKCKEERFNQSYFSIFIVAMAD